MPPPPTSHPPNHPPPISLILLNLWLGWIWWNIQLTTYFYFKKVFFKVVLYVFLVTDQFCTKWLSQKNVIFCPKKAFFLTKNAIYTPAPPNSTLVSRNFFSYGIPLHKSWRIFYSKLQLVPIRMALPFSSISQPRMHQF